MNLFSMLMANSGGFWDVWHGGLKIVALIIMAICGVLLLILPNEKVNLWAKNKYKISLILGSATVILLILGLHPYAAIFSFVLLGVKSLIILFRK